MDSFLDLLDTVGKTLRTGDGPHTLRMSDYETNQEDWEQLHDELGYLGWTVEDVSDGVFTVTNLGW